MTSLQHHYPFFLDMAILNGTLLPLHWKAEIVVARTKDDHDYLSIRKIFSDDTSKPEAREIKVAYHEFLMVKGSRLYCWRKYEDGLLVRQFQLDDDDPHGSMPSEFIETIKLDPGTHPHLTQLSYDHFVTFWRKENLMQEEEWYERYVIIHMHQQEISIIPLDSFNKTGGDPLYMWPALAVLDVENGVLYGLGMRMGSFEVAMNGT